MASKKQAEVVQFNPQEGTVAYRILNGEVATPPELVGKVDVRNWLISLTTGAEYEEPDENAMAQAIMFESLSITSLDQMWDDGTPQKLQEAIENFPGATTGPVDIVDLIVTGSDYEDGNNTYVIMTLVDVETRVAEKFSTGATTIQADLLRHIGLGVWPIRCQIARTKSKDKGGRYLLKMFPEE
jgi:hypothetical protein